MAVELSVAVRFWIERARGKKIREICALHDVDPRRIYEVFQGESYPESLELARSELKKETPQLAAKLQHHTPRLKVIKKETHFQDRLL